MYAWGNADRGYATCAAYEVQLFQLVGMRTGLLFISCILFVHLSYQVLHVFPFVGINDYFFGRCVFQGLFEAK